MPLIVAGVSHKTAPVELREKISFSAPQLERVLEQAKSKSGLGEVALLSTCNRTEIYASSDRDPEEAKRGCVQFLKEQYGEQNLERFIYTKTDRETIDHLFRVASGLDSMVVGENEILKQVKDAYQLAQKFGLTGKVLNVFFQRALYVGKLVRTHTGISQGALSVGSVAVTLAEKIFGDLAQCSVLIFGAGKMAEISARYLLERRAKKLWVANRTYENAVALAQRFDAEPLSLAEGLEHLALADVVIGSAASSEPILPRALIQQVMALRHNRSLFLIDIAVPRNVDPAAHKMDNVYLYNIDDLESIVQENLKGRSEEIAKAARIVEEKCSEFDDWVRALRSGEEKSLKHFSEQLERRTGSNL